MDDYNKAYQIAEKIIIEEWGDDVVIYDEKVTTQEDGWLFPYTTKKYLLTNDTLDGLISNPPLFVSKDFQEVEYRSSVIYEKD